MILSTKMHKLHALRACVTDVSHRDALLMRVRERVKRDTGASVVAQVTRVIEYGTARDMRCNPEYFTVY